MAQTLRGHQAVVKVIAIAPYGKLISVDLRHNPPPTYPRIKESWPRDVGMEYDWEQVFGKAADRVPIFITEFGWQGTG